MALFDAAKEGYELTKIDGRPVLFTNIHLNRDTVPAGTFCYGVRGSDALDGSMTKVKAMVAVNYWGTILCEDPSPIDEYGSYYPKGWGYLGKNTSLEELQGIGREQPVTYLPPEALQTEPVMQESLP